MNIRIEDYSGKPNFIKKKFPRRKTWVVIKIIGNSVYWWNIIEEKFIHVCYAYEQPRTYLDGFFMEKKKASEILKNSRYVIMSEHWEGEYPAPKKKPGMEELKIYRFQADHIEDALRKVNNVLKCHTKESCLDRDVMQSIEMIKAVLERNPNKETWRNRYKLK